jgi:hypothetical protein
MTTQEAVKKVKSMVKKDFGMSFTDLKKEILKTVPKGMCSSDHFKSVNGYSIFYTGNTNYKQGKWNGGGKGFYAALNGVGTCRTVKL